MERLTRLTAASAPKRFVRFSTALRLTRAGEDADRLGRDPRGFRGHELDVVPGKTILERHVARHREPRRELTPRDDRRHVAAARGEDAGVAAEALEPRPALFVAVALEDH